MKIKELSLSHFRNYETLDMHFDDGVTILTGENAQGKTNLLEAIFLLSVAKSHRTNNDQELIQWDHEQAIIKGLIETKHYSFPLELTLSSKGKIAKVNHIEQARLSQFVGKLNVVLFAPEDLQIIKGSPSQRRRFLDTELGQSHPIYLQELVDYHRLLRSRNRYLKDTTQDSSFDPLYFQILTDQLIDKAVNIINYRVDFVERIDSLARNIHDELSKQRDELQLIYEPSVKSRFDYASMETLKDQFEEAFKAAFERERQMGVTQYGPHRDDLSFIINGRNAQFFGSQGQQRTIILSLKLAEIELLHQLLGEYPVLLLDDVLSELDDQRQHQLISRIEHRIQTFLTTASIEGLELNSFEQASLYYIEAGHVHKANLKGNE